MTASDAIEALLDALDIEETDHVEIIAEQDDDGWYIEVAHEEVARLH